MGKGGNISMDTDFMWVRKPEPHIARTEAILEAHPEVKELFGPDNMTFFKVFGVVGLQIYLASRASEMSTAAFFGISYCIGGFASQNLFLANHELSHNLGFQTPILNRLLGLVANIPICIPFVSSFSKYHPLHHRHQGSDTVDMDIPAKFEASCITNRFTKLIWVSLQLVFYAGRPMYLFPIPVGLWDIINLLAIVAADYFMVTNWGWSSIYFLVASAFLGGGLHPAAGHFISEHYVFKGSGEQETFSYYGPLNPVLYNVGYHNEHHDFPRIPGSRLHKVHELAPEFYQDLHSHKSWTGVIARYVMERSTGPFSRVKRSPTTETIQERTRVSKGGLSEVYKLKAEWATRPKTQNY